MTTSKFKRLTDISGSTPLDSSDNYFGSPIDPHLLVIHKGAGNSALDNWDYEAAKRGLTECGGEYFQEIVIGNWCTGDSYFLCIKDTAPTGVMDKVGMIYEDIWTRQAFRSFVETVLLYSSEDEDGANDKGGFIYTEEYEITYVAEDDDDDVKPGDGEVFIIIDKTLVSIRHRFLELAAEGARFLRDECVEMSPSEFGYYIYLSANGHGTGFWDLDLPDPVIDRLENLSERLGYTDACLGGFQYIHLVTS